MKHVLLSVGLILSSVAAHAQLKEVPANTLGAYKIAVIQRIQSMECSRGLNVSNMIDGATKALIDESSAQPVITFIVDAGVVGRGIVEVVSTDYNTISSATARYQSLVNVDVSQDIRNPIIEQRWVDMTAATSCTSQAK
ncbi:hypothetical protein [Pseudobdellovibrio exovorus]|uniref:Uncharacterized protein n=1 Tax=Pseudobdellovibrio exovorus JSS TaxID=1184267 RepID=M4VBL1_9BACT|nr:hypothetical protein [Pseudobdellovibrio exovorus]AGH95411.1 hypothetical protein A11Q_1195 [Pseudobdellovibrio exovorus JSS]